MNLTFTKISKFIILCILLWGTAMNQSFAQLSTNYGFSQSLGTFTPITGGTILGTATNDDASFNGSSVGVQFNAAIGTGFPIGFTFTYNGQSYNNFGVNSNGWIRLDTGTFTISNSSTPLNSTFTSQNFKNIICALGRDIQGKAGIGELSYVLEGVSPNQTLVVQWLNYAKFSSISNTLDTLSFQIRLNETLNTIDFVYGSAVNMTQAFGSSQFQVGINGNIISDYLNRETTTDWTNTVAGITRGAFCALSSTVFPPSGLKFTYGLLSGDINPPIIANEIISPLAGCIPVSHTVTADITDTSGIASAEILWSLDGVLQPAILMSNVGSLYSGTIPASGNSIIVYSIRAIDAGVNSIIANKSGGSYQDNYLLLSAGTDKLINAGDSVSLNSSSPFLAALKISEVTFNAGGTGVQLVWPSYIIKKDDNIELVNLSTQPLDISGYTINYIEQFAPTPLKFTFPSGTIVPSDSLVIVHIGIGIDDLVNRLFNIQNSTGLLSGRASGIYIKDASGNVIDAVSFNGFTFPASTGVLNSDFSGSAVVSLVSFAGPSLIGSDLNSNANWISSSVTNITSMGIRNVGLVTAVTPTVSWTGGILSGTVLGNNISTPIHPNAGIFTYVASITDGICTSTDTVLVNVIAPTLPDAEFSVNKTVGTSGGIVTAFNFTDLTTNLPSAWSWTFVPNTVTYLTGTNSNSQNPIVKFDSAAVYSVSLLASNISGSNTESKTNLITITRAYCASNATSTLDSDIGNVTFGAFSNGSDTLPATNNPTSINTYSDFSALAPINFSAGASYPISITQINRSSFFTGRTGVYVDLNQDGAFDPVSELIFSGATFANNRVASGNATIPPTALTGNTRMRVVLIEVAAIKPCGTYTWGETEDYTINITPPPANDASISSINIPNSGCNLSASELITVNVFNGGINSVNNLPVSYTINGGNPVSESIAGPIPSLTTISYTFTTVADLSASGNYLISAYTSLAGDSFPNNDNKDKTIVNNPLIATFPYEQDFSSARGWVSNPVSGNGSWSIVPSMISPNLSPVFGTGILLFRSFNYRSGVKGMYGFSCGYDFSSLLSPQIELYVSQDIGFSSFTDYVAIDVSTDNGLTFTAVDSIFRYNPAFIPAGFKKFEISLAAYGGQANVLIALRGVSDFGNNIGVDKFKVYEPTLFDAGVISVDSLKSGCGLSATNPVYVTIKNFGALPTTSIQVSFQVDGGLIITETANLTIIENSEVQYLFNNTANLSAPGDHIIQAWTTLLSDSNPTNDSAKFTVQSLASSAIPIVNNVTVCSGSPALLTASGSANSFNWYDALVGGNLLFSGSSYSVSPAVSTSYFVEGIDVVSANVGALDTTFSQGFQYNYFLDGLVFDAISNVNINSVVVYPGSAGSVIIQIQDSFGNIIGISNSTIIDSTQIGSRILVPVNINVPMGSGYQITANSSTVSSLFINTSGANYPYSASGLINILGVTNGFGVSGDYLFFYDWSVSNTICPSPRAAAQVNVNEAPLVNLGVDQVICSGNSIVLDAENSGNTFLWSTGATTQTITVNSAGSYSVLVSNAAGCFAIDTIDVTVSLAANADFTFVQEPFSTTVTFSAMESTGTHEWTFGDGTGVFTTSSRIHPFAKGGNYLVNHIQTSLIGCSDTNTVQISVNSPVGFTEQFISAFSYQVYPNPIQNETRIAYELKERSTVQINVFDVLGRKVIENQTINQTIGKHELMVNKDQLTSGSGVYEVQIIVNGIMESLKLVVLD